MEQCNRSKMLMQIADQLNLFSTIEKINKKEKEREELLAQKISAILEEKRFLLILDDMRLFFPYDLDGLGVPRPYIQNKSSKVLITGSEYLLNNEGANNVLSLVGGLPIHEAWYLFCEKAEMTFSSPDLRPLAEMLVKDNSIGPLDTIILAGALRNREGGADLCPMIEGRYLLSLSTDKNHVMMHDSLRDRQHYIFDKGSDLILANPEFFLDDRRIYLMDAKLRTKSPKTLEPTRPAILLLHGDGGCFLTEIKDAFIQNCRLLKLLPFSILRSNLSHHSFPICQSFVFLC
ncbi:hypothetical protein GIB67_032325 [Kingdonia uniflora]|uniref:NB-ARC domain-containing protein n=1 Tax=Kingdonia uniflora TaxID=39325 RepID=A0A7J7MXN2_9MAGN|nr:hypothetical protein GIB67_032325 [Kingdonia uniflora]